VLFNLLTGFDADPFPFPLITADSEQLLYLFLRYAGNGVNSSPVLALHTVCPLPSIFLDPPQITNVIIVNNC